MLISIIANTTTSEAENWTLNENSMKKILIVEMKNWL